MSYLNQDLSRELYLFDSFLQSRGSTNWNTQTLTGATTIFDAATGHMGIIKFTTGSGIGATGQSRASLRYDTIGMLIGSGCGADWIFGAVASPANLSTITGEFIFTMGFFDQSINIDAANGAYFEYDRINGGDFWRTCTAKTSTRTKTTTNIAISVGAWSSFKIEVPNSGNVINFFIDGKQVASHSTNLPDSTVPTSISYVSRKVSGAADFPTLSLDISYVYARLTNPLYP